MGYRRVRALLSGVLMVLSLLAASGTVPGADPPRPPLGGTAPGSAPPRPESQSGTPHRAGELECRNCHVGQHQGILQMYVGVGGRGTPMIPSHMFQVRVECIACHTAPKIEPGTARIVGQTFRPGEQACITCHGPKYRGMLEQWTTTLTRMRETVEPKVVAARAALTAVDARHPHLARARQLMDDAEFNVRFVALARGVHNVFYAADLLKVSNGWLDEALALLGQASPKVDDQLVRGGYCAVLCHAAAGVKPRASVVFAGQTIPHGRHISEFGATCTSCHSAETHKAVTATRTTCTACHHSAQNERCESCHRAQSAFYRGQLKTPPVPISANVMAEAVTCTGCHDWSQKPSRAAIGQKCVGCHDAASLTLLTEWTGGFAADLRRTAEDVRKAEAALARARRGGRKTAEAEALLGQARAALATVRGGGVAHNPLAADALLVAAREKAALSAAAAGLP